MTATLPSPTASRSAAASAATSAGQVVGAACTIAGSSSPCAHRRGGVRSGAATASTRLASVMIDAGVR